MVKSEQQLKDEASEASLPTVLKTIRQCESKGDYQAQNAYSSASGAFQIVTGTWNGYGGYIEAKMAPKHVQDAKAIELYNQRGTQPWEQCMRPRVAVAKVSSDVQDLYPDPKSRWGTCVPWAKAQTGIDHSIGWGARDGIQGKEPRINAIGALNGSVHAVVVTAINGNQITFKESGFKTGWITQRTLPLSSFRGFIYS